MIRHNWPTHLMIISYGQTRKRHLKEGLVRIRLLVNEAKKGPSAFAAD